MVYTSKCLFQLIDFLDTQNFRKSVQYYRKALASASDPKLKDKLISRLSESLDNLLEYCPSLEVFC